MKTDDPVPSLLCFGEGENYSPYPGGMLRGPPCLSPVLHLVFISLAVFFFFPSLGLSAHPCPSTLLSHPTTGIWCSGWEAAEPDPDHQGCRPHCWDELGEDLLQILAAWWKAHHSQSHDPALRHSSPLPPPPPWFPVSCSSPSAFSSPPNAQLHLRLLLRAAAPSIPASSPVCCKRVPPPTRGRPPQTRPAGKPCV